MVIEEWKTIFYENAMDNTFREIIQLNDGTFMAIGQTSFDVQNENGSFSPQFICRILKLNQDGEIIKTSEFEIDNSGCPSPNKLIQLPDNSIIAGGDIGPTSFVRDLAWLASFTIDGDINWSNSFGSQAFDNEINDIKLSNSGNILVTGGLNDNLWLSEFSSDGNQNWENLFGGSNRDIGFSVFELEGRGYIISGITQSSDGDITDREQNDDADRLHWLFKVKPNRKF